MLGSTIQRELASFIMRELSDPRIPKIVSLTRVVLTSDLEYADIYISVMGTPGQQSAALMALKHSSGLMRTYLTRALSLRQAPFLRFQMDAQLKKELEVLELIELAKREDLARERARTGEAEPTDDDEEVEPAGEAEAPAAVAPETSVEAPTDKPAPSAGDSAART